MKNKLGPFHVVKKDHAKFHHDTGVKKEFTQFWIRDQNDMSFGLFTTEYGMSCDDASTLAHLQAAAPELLEALEKLYNGLSSKDTIYAAGLWNLLQKAKGELTESSNESSPA